jgi:hypothetical protein
VKEATRTGIHLSRKHVLAGIKRALPAVNPTIIRVNLVVNDSLFRKVTIIF